MAQTMAELKDYRTHIFHDACDFNHPDRIPHLGAYITWKIIDYGCKFSEAFNDYELMEKVVRQFIERYPVDALMDTGVRNSFNVMEAFGEKGFYYYDDEAEVVGVHPYEIAPIEDLEEYVADPTKYIWTKALPRKFGQEAWESKTLEIWQKTWDENGKFNAFAGHIGKVLAEEYGLPGLSSPIYGFVTPFIETLFGSVRGIRGLSIDLRRNVDKIKAAVETMDARGIKTVTQKILDGDEGHDYNACFDLSLMMLSHTILHMKNFDEIYWPSLGPFIAACGTKGKNLRITAEGAIMRFSDYFKDLKRGTLTLLLEQDDIFEFRKLLPNVAFIGGMPSTVLGMGTKEECLDITKKLCDEIPVDGGGYIYSTDKFISYRNDAKAENVKACCDYILEYRCK